MVSLLTICNSNSVILCTISITLCACNISLSIKTRIILNITCQKFNTEKSFDISTSLIYRCIILYHYVMCKTHFQITLVVVYFKEIHYNTVLNHVIWNGKFSDQTTMFYWFSFVIHRRAKKYKTLWVIPWHSEINVFPINFFKEFYNSEQQFLWTLEIFTEKTFISIKWNICLFNDM